jgi:hypothetical protein
MAVEGARALAERALELRADTPALAVAYAAAVATADGDRAQDIEQRLRATAIRRPRSHSPQPMSPSGATHTRGTSSRVRSSPTIAPRKRVPPCCRHHAGERAMWSFSAPSPPSK